MRFRSIAARPLAYGASLALSKGVSLALMPWVAAHLAPAEYGRLEVLASAMEFVGLVLSFGIADTLFRFAGLSSSQQEQRRREAAMAALSVMLAAGSAILLQLAAPALRALLPVAIDPLVFRLSLVAIASGSLIDLSLGWLRLRDRPIQFLCFMALRAGLQLILVGLFVAVAACAEAVLAASAAVELSFAAVLLVMQVRATGLVLSREALTWLRSYSAPLLLSGLAAFALGSCDRWFLVGHVPAADLGQYGVAAKIAAAAAFLTQPFGLYWYARRLGVLAEPDGLRHSADMVALGFAVLLTGGATVAVAGPAFVRIALPSGYAQATAWIPWLVAASVLNETASLLNAGCYARRTAWRVTAVNIAGAIAAIAGYALLIPAHGIEGAIVATLAAQTVRVVGFLVAGHRFAPIPYRIAPIVALAVLAAGSVWVSAAALPPAMQVGTALLLPVLCIGLARALGLLPADRLRRGFSS